METPTSNPTQKTPVPAVKKVRHRLPTGWIIAGAIALVGIGWFTWRKLHPPDAVGPVILGAVTRGDLLETVSATGSVEAQTGAQIRIGSQVTGTIKHLYADVGAKVKAGQVIADLDLPDVAATLSQAKSAYQGADSKWVQSTQSLTLGKSQTKDAVTVAREALEAAKEAVKTAQANYKLQSTQTPTDIRKADAAREQAVAALKTAQATYEQTVAGANLNIASAQETVDQAKATLALDLATYNREKLLDAQGFVSKLVVDQAKQAYLVADSAERAAEQQLNLTKQKVDADLKTANQAVVQAQKGVESAVAALDAAKAEIYTTKARAADVQNAVALAKEAQGNLQLAIGNLETNAVNQQSVEQAKAAKVQAQDQIVVDQAQFDKTVLKSPISGTVISLTSQQGETVAAGLAAPTLIVVTDLSRLEVEAYVDETDIGKIQLGQTATVTVDAFPGKTFYGKVFKSSSGSTIQEGVITYDVSISINDPSQQLRPDMTANITIQTGHLSNVMMIPAVAVQQTLSGTFVKIAKKVDGQTKISLVPIKIGGTDGVNVEVVSGLAEGQQIVLAGGPQNAATPPTNATSSPLAGGGGGRGR